MDERAAGVHARQIVMEFDMATWKVELLSCLGNIKLNMCITQRAIEVWNITESRIPQRPPARTRIGDKWYG